MEKKKENEMETREYIGNIMGLYRGHIGEILGIMENQMEKKTEHEMEVTATMCIYIYIHRYIYTYIHTYTYIYITGLYRDYVGFCGMDVFALFGRGIHHCKGPYELNIYATLEHTGKLWIGSLGI